MRKLSEVNALTKLQKLPTYVSLRIKKEKMKIGQK